MKVLSLFDGISCGRVALERAGIPVTQYIASEIDTHAIKVSHSNYPDTVRLGDVRNVRHMAECGLLGHVDVLIGGSPCQGFSMAGKQLAFDDPRSALFFEFVLTLRALQRTNPNIKFMLENVRMKKEHLDVISSYLGVQPVMINSSLVSAQNRVRFYWCNWSVEQPEDRGIYLRDIIDEDCNVETHTLSAAATARAARTKYSKPQILPEKTGTLNTKNNSGQLSFDSGTTLIPVGAAVRGRYVNGVSGETRQGLELRKDEKANCITTHTKDSVVTVKQRPRGNNPGFMKPMEKCPTITSNSFGHNVSISTNQVLRVGTATDIKGHDYNKRIYSTDGKAPCLTAASGGNLEPKIIAHTDDCALNEITYRKLSPIECERLQTLPDNYTSAVSNSQRYKQLGNGWTVEVIVHIFKGMPR